jgi:hypothetical protein
MINECNTLEKDASQTADFILFMDTLFDSLNGNNKTSCKPLKCGVPSFLSSQEKFCAYSLHTKHHKDY